MGQHSLLENKYQKGRNIDEVKSFAWHTHTELRKSPLHAPPRGEQPCHGFRSSPAQGQAHSPPVPAFSPPSRGRGSSQQGGAHLGSRIPRPTWHCRRPPAHWCSWGAVPRPLSRLPAHCCHSSPEQETLCPTSSSTRAPRAAALTPPARCLPLPPCLSWDGGSSPLLLEWSNSLPPAPATLGSAYKKTDCLSALSFSESNW